MYQILEMCTFISFIYLNTILIKIVIFLRN